MPVWVQMPQWERLPEAVPLPAVGGGCVGLPAASTSTERRLAMRSRVRLKGLVARPDLNGKEGVVTSFDNNTCRYGVMVEDVGATFALKHANLAEHFPNGDGSYEASGALQTHIGDDCSDDDRRDGR